MQNTLLNELSASLSKDEEIRNKASNYLKSIRSTPGLAPLLVIISLDVSHSEEVRKEAAYYLQNLCRNWKGYNSEYSIPQLDKVFLKFHVLRCLRLSIPKNIRYCFKKIANTMAKADYPWDEILNQIEAGLNDPNLAYAALSMIHQISKNYKDKCEKKIKECRKLMFGLLSRFFSKMLEIMKIYVSFINIECFTYVKVILKIYWIALDNNLPPRKSEDPLFNEWMTCFRIILEYPMENEQNRPESEESERILKKLPQWKCKKITAEIVEFLFYKYSDLSPLDFRGSLLTYRLKKIWIIEFFKVIIRQVLQIKERFIPGFVLQNFLIYTCRAVRFSPTSRFFDKNSISHLMINIIMPLLYRRKYYDDRWKSIPIAGIIKETNLRIPCRDILRNPAINLLQELCKKGALVKFFRFITRELQQSTDSVQKETILLVIGSLSDELMSIGTQINLEAFIIDFVLCEFTNQICFLRSSAVWVYSRFSNLPLKSHEFKALGLEAVCKLLLDPELLVRHEASLALIDLLKWEISKKRLSQEIKSLLEIYLKLLN